MEAAFCPIKKRLKLTVLLWIRLPRLPLEMWNEKVLRHTIGLIGNLTKIDQNSEEVKKGLFARSCVADDVSKPLKRTIKYVLDDVCNESLLDYENITSLYFGCGANLTRLMCANSILKILLLSWKSFRSSPKLITSGYHNENKTDTQEADWVEVRLKRTPRTNKNQGKGAGKINQNDNATFKDLSDSKIDSPRQWYR